MMSKMSWRLHDTIFGQFVRLVTSKRYFLYPDEIDQTLLRKAVQIHGENLAISGNDSGDKEESNAPKTEREKTGPDDTLLVGWYGDGDPEVHTS